jgi:hypothetical protein
MIAWMGQRVQFFLFLFILVSVPSSGSRKNGNSAASSEERIPLKPEEVKWKCIRGERGRGVTFLPCFSCEGWRFNLFVKSL